MAARLMRRRLMGAMAVAVAFATGLPASALAVTSTIGWRPGGDVYTHIIQALDMIRSGRSYRVTADQYSAAAMQVVYLKSQIPGRICATRGAKLHFHRGFDRQTNRPIKQLDPVWVAFIRPENLKRLGPLPEYGKGFKTVRASDYLGLCR